MGLFSKCLRCGKRKLAFSVGSDGICSDCHTAIWQQRGAEIVQRAARKQTPQKSDAEKFNVSSFVKQADSGYTPPPSTSDEPTYVFIDVETTGLNPTKDAIVQISALRFFGRKMIDGLNSYVDPLRPIPSASTAIHGITDAKVKDSPTIDKIKEPFLKLIEGAILVGHNATFDLNFLDYAFHGALDGIEYIDTLEIAKALLDLPNYKLKTVADYAEFYPEGGYHDSLADCAATAAIFFRLAFDKPGLAKTYHSKIVEDISLCAETESEDEGDAAPYMDVIRQICQDAEIAIKLHSIPTEKGFDITHKLYIWFRVKLSGKLNYLLVPMPRPEVEDLLRDVNLEIADASKSETPHSHCRIMISSPSDFYSAAPVITACIREQMKYL